jgi:ATP-binding cassette subfamily D (ALD) protein 3
LEGEFRACHTGIIRHSEEIAFYRGNNWEKERINDIFNDLNTHIDNIYSKRFYMGFFDSLILKYGSVTVGYCLLAVPVFGKNSEQYKSHSDVGTITRDYISNSQNLINLSKVYNYLTMRR